MEKITNLPKIMIGIYKITSPNNRVYIGQSINIKKRFYQYNNNCNKKQIRLYNSFFKYGVENHIFEIIEECDKEDLNDRERYWQEYYNVLSKSGLNCVLVNTSDKPVEFSVETRLQMKKNNKKARKVIHMLSKEVWNSAKDCATYYNMHPDRLTDKLRHRTINNSYLLYYDEVPMEGINYNCEVISGGDMPILDINTNEVYKSLKDCCKENNLVYSTTLNKLNGKRKNNTKFMRISKNEYMLIKFKKLYKKCTTANKISIFNIYDTEYINLLNYKILELEEKIYEEMKENMEYDSEKVYSCKHCKSLYIKVDDDGNDICHRCGSINEIVEYKDIFDYKDKCNK